MVLCAECRVSWDTEFGPLVTGYSATCGNDDSKPCFICCSAREVGNSAEGGISEPGSDYVRGGGPESVFCFGRSCIWGQRQWRSSCVRVCQRVTLCWGRSRLQTNQAVECFCTSGLPCQKFTVQWRRHLNPNCSLGWRGFKFIVTLNAFTKVQWTDAGIMWSNRGAYTAARRPASWPGVQNFWLLAGLVK